MTTTIKSITSKEFTKDGKTTVSTTVELANGVSGYLDDKNSARDLKQYEVVNYLLEVKKNKSKGTDYNLLSIERAPSTQAGAPGTGMYTAPASTPAEVKFVAPPHAKVDIIKMKFDSRMQLCELTHRLIIEGKLSDAEAKLHLTAWCSEMDNLIDGIFA